MPHPSADPLARFGLQAKEAAEELAAGLARATAAAERIREREMPQVQSVAELRASVLQQAAAAGMDVSGPEREKAECYLAGLSAGLQMSTQVLRAAAATLPHELPDVEHIRGLFEIVAKELETSAELG